MPKQLGNIFRLAKNAITGLWLGLFLHNFHWNVAKIVCKNKTQLLKSTENNFQTMS